MVGSGGGGRPFLFLQNKLAEGVGWGKGLLNSMTQTICQWGEKKSSATKYFCDGGWVGVLPNSTTLAVGTKIGWVGGRCWLLNSTMQLNK